MTWTPGISQTLKSASGFLFVGNPGSSHIGGYKTERVNEHNNTTEINKNHNKNKQAACSHRHATGGRLKGPRSPGRWRMACSTKPQAVRHRARTNQHRATTTDKPSASRLYLMRIPTAITTLTASDPHQNRSY